jgi:mitochondrial chaperone BCS1
MDLQPIIELLNQQWLLNQLGSNEFLIAGIAGALFYILRDIPNKILYFIERNITIEFTLTNEDEMYDELVKFIDDSRIKLLSRTYSKIGKNINSSDDYFSRRSPKSDVKDENELSIGYGPSWIFYNRTFGYVIRKFKEDNHSNQLKEEIFIKLFTRNKNVLVNLLSECTANKKIEPHVYTMSNHYFEKTCKLQKRDFDTVYIPDNTKKSIIGMFDSFLNNYDDYQKKGLPYKLGIMFEGPPGTGKSSLVKAIASYLNRDLYFVSGNDIAGKGKVGFIHELSHLSKNSILVLEELDSLGGAGDRKDENSNSNEISGLLNILDGILTPPGLIVLATTNYIHKIDPAILRKGRFDKIYHIDLLNYDLFCKMVSNLWGVNIEIINSKISEFEFKPIEGAKIYSAYAEFSDNFELAIELLKNENFSKNG